MLEIDKISVSFGTINVLRELSLSVKEGETVGIIGPNGSGKTTLLNAISGFAEIKGGSIKYRDKDITKLPPFQRARLGFGRVFQNFGVFHEMTLKENIILALESASGGFFSSKLSKKESESRAVELLREIHLAEKANHKTSNLSGGQKRLLEIVRALAMNSDLFLLDEPTAGVSPKMKGDLISVIKKVQEMGKTILVIEHDMNFIYSFCERLVVLDQGQVILDGKPDEIKNSEVLREIYFGK